MILIPRIRTLVLPFAVGGVLLAGCEEYEDPAAGTTPAAEPAGAQSAYGKAHERAERLKDEIDAYQQEVSRQADTVFDDAAARDAERAAPPGASN
ncbi:MAG: hypothetical protein GY895_11435 [Phycisphaera sp.]|nr:hypothetical protein [Phycisphaera sp.]